MKRFLVLSIVAVLFAAPGVTRAQVNVGVSLDEDGLRSFHMAIGDYYHVPQSEVMVVRDRGIPDDELPVVFFLAARARVSPRTVVDLRLGGWSWDRITVHYGFGPDIYYVPVPVMVEGPPYGHAYGYYKKHPRREWKKMRLGDDDIVNLVDLRFVSEHEKVAPQEIIRLRSAGKPFVTVASEIRKEKGRPGNHSGDAKPAKHGGHGQGKGHGKKKG